MRRTPLRGSSATLIGVAFLSHAPGLWLMYRLRLGLQTKRQNAVAIALTIIAVTTVYVLTGDVVASSLVWAVGHVAWGAWLAGRVLRGLETR